MTAVEMNFNQHFSPGGDSGVIVTLVHFAYMVFDPL